MSGHIPGHSHDELLGRRTVILALACLAGAAGEILRRRLFSTSAAPPEIREIPKEIPAAPEKLPLHDPADYKFLLSYLSQDKLGEPQHIYGLHPYFCTMLADTIRRLEKQFPEVKSKLRIFSGQRSVERQIVRFLDSLTQKGSVKKVRETLGIPGASQHNFPAATAVDIDWDKTKGNPYDKRPDSPWYIYLRDNKESFGIHFPLLKKRWRARGNEPWHVEPAGTVFLRQALAENGAFAKNREIFIGLLKEIGIIDAKGTLQRKSSSKESLYAEFQTLWLHRGVRDRESKKRAFADRLVARMRQKEPGYPFFPSPELIEQSLCAGGLPRAQGGACPRPPAEASESSRRGFLFLRSALG